VVNSYTFVLLFAQNIKLLKTFNILHYDSKDLKFCKSSCYNGHRHDNKNQKPLNKSDNDLQDQLDKKKQKTGNKRGINRHNLHIIFFVHVVFS